MKRISTLMFSLMALLMLPLSANGQVDVANIAAFNAVEDGTLVKLTLTNARVNALNTLANPATYYIEDASGATAVKGISLTTGKLLNGYIVGKKATEDVDYVNTPSQGYEYSLNVEDPTLSSITTSDATMTGTSMTIAEACKQENYGKLVTKETDGCQRNHENARPVLCFAMGLHMAQQSHLVHRYRSLLHDWMVHYATR